jgi:hypothetical protein
VIYPKSFFGIGLGMDKSIVKSVYNSYDLVETDVYNGNGNINFSVYKGNIEIYDFLFEKATVYYGKTELVDAIIFKLFVPIEHDVYKKIFKKLCERLEPNSFSYTDEALKENYLFMYKDEKKRTVFIRVYVEEVLQGNRGHNIYLTTSYKRGRLVTKERSVTK